MKPLTSRLFAAAAVALLASPAMAQNAGQIASARGGASCTGCNLFQADFAGVELPGRSFAGARLRQADLSLAVLTRANLAGADLRDANGYAAVLSSANLSRADLTNSSWVGAHLHGANFSGAKLSGANFSGAELERVVGLSQSQLNAACGDETTRLPQGFSIPPCG
jgi:uncharacterized protein YjbI with pentapeptide repeats